MSAFLYLFPCAGEDLVKLGISRDPLGRIRGLAPRWFEFFDLDHALLLQADALAEAQAWETALKRSLREYNAPAPLLSVAAAGGHTEWFRGAQRDIRTHMDAMAEQGFHLHPARPWLRDALLRGSDDPYGRAEAIWQAMLDAGVEPESSARHPFAQALRDLCDEQIALDLALDARVPSAIAAWHRRHRA
ncbi:GIY-YIG nuclease family protein [Pseudoxanthomonas sp. PXM04]|uniref:GIY-YIG nuclease family protein n=1 Tax=Pseudoxanthomonas sp. PXM04 TaxID=2769297 RepID=UPI00177BFE0B|nr:GIY-YIG nuclease family protein [Pseudoxanthomonas sp. PXM04]MBD9378016.1 GIY-YIG nuclease family protein [Pseudoxanthomonas sp. PXM04]